MGVTGLKLGAGLVSVKILLIGAALWIGAALPLPPALRGFVTECSQPGCWYGIVPGETPYAEADMLLRRYGFAPVGEQQGAQRLCVQYQGAEALVAVCPFQQPRLSASTLVELAVTWQTRPALGDLFSVLGMPDSAACDPHCAAWEIGFAGPRVIVQSVADVGIDLPPLALMLPVRGFRLEQRAHRFAYIWRGMGTLRDYQRGADLVDFVLP